MEKNNFSTSWKESSQARKQHKFRYNAPLHIKQKLLHVHLSADLRQKYHTRNVQVRKGDKIKVVRGQWRKKEGKVEKVNLKKEKVFVTGVEIIRKDGTRVLTPLTPSNLMIIDFDLSDKKRKGKLESLSQNKNENKKDGSENKSALQSVKQQKQHTGKLS